MNTKEKEMPRDLLTETEGAFQPVPTWGALSDPGLSKLYILN